MEISEAFHKDVAKMMIQYKDFDELELEGRYVGQSTRVEFDRCVQYCKSDPDFRETIQEDVLDVLVENNLRISIHGSKAIAEYCKSNVVPADSTVISKTMEASVLFEDIDFKINLKREAPKDASEYVDTLYMKDKSYRFKKRYSYESDVVRVDLTVVKSAMGSFRNFVESRVMSKPETYEIEVEVIRRQDPKSATTSFLNHMLNLYGALAEEDHVCSKKEKKQALEEYFKLCYKEIPQNYQRAPKLYFAGPQPITLERKNIAPAGLGVTTIREDYTVTEKADGERCLLFVSKSGGCYFINSRLVVKYAGVRLEGSKGGPSLLDGEYITEDFEGDDIREFAIFDCYYADGADVRHLPLVGGDDSRLAKAEAFVKRCKASFASEEMKIYAKEFLYGDDIFKKAGEILSKEKTKGYEYRIDGLIFTPMHLPVGGMFAKDRLDKPVGTWPMVFKWKRPDDNTIDFLIKYRRGTSNNPVITFVNSMPHRIVDLFVGHDPANWEKITARSYLEGSFVRKSKSYVPVSFKPNDVVDDGITSCLLPLKISIDGEELEDDSIVEFKYDNTDDLPPYELKWAPVRIRKDKTEMYRRTKTLSGAVNDLSSALNIWRSIRVPVTEDMISGKARVDEIPLQEDAYYVRRIDREKFASKAMMDFHNSVKRKLISSNKADSLVDMACGQGGDLRKFIDSGFTRVLGFDYNRNNIEHPTDGIYARTMDRSKPPSSARYAFLPYDLSQRIDPNAFENPDDKHVANVIYGHAKDMKLSKYERMAVEKFDVVNCQFAIHYFFESERKLDNFLENVSAHLKEGGVFIGTCLNGYDVKNMLGDRDEIEGRQNDRVMWNVRKLYSKPVGVVYGEQIEVYMESIGRVMKEYLVNLDLLEKKLKAKGFQKVETKGFSEYFDEDSPKLDEAQKRYSFMNSTFAFAKSGPPPKGRVLKKKIIVAEN